ncbi:hypothetical protein [Oscillatoria salina]|uniref:hypothetical protein n=1 Tax=Oscillatoria salina TaxID=331517 RepID=UPI0013B84490|nr:hypothetical protein [Oscillatoria salina]MBZ8181259.1 hypothetical protein [Oscillatoria salina IIICB1]NET90411.1 hypothetical protein [Kamptonema sp. SIO1D9]
MATKEQVKQYLAYWFQLGKKALVDNGRKSVLPEPVIIGDRYSHKFEELWQYLLSPESGDCYLEGTEQTISELLTSAWEINSCARCEMPVPVRNTGVQPLSCPCIDLPLWPNEELPKPRSPVDSFVYLSRIQERSNLGS